MLCLLILIIPTACAKGLADSIRLWCGALDAVCVSAIGLEQLLPVLEKIAQV
jgi:hypothetical protein